MWCFCVCNEAILAGEFFDEEACDTGKVQIVSSASCTTSSSTMGWGRRKFTFMQTTAQENNAMIHYLTWGVLCGLHKDITLSFLVVDHTKFSPDWCFGLFVQKDQGGITRQPG